MPARKLAPGKWEANINYNGKRIHKRGFTTKREAEAYEAEYKKMADHDLTMSFETFVKCYFADKGTRLKERTIHNKQYMIDRHVTPFFTGKPINSITTKDILDWQNEILAKGYEPTYNRMLQNQISSLFNHAVRFYGLRDNPCSRAKRIGRSNAKELTFWTKEEYAQFIKTFEPGTIYYTAFETLFWTGMRCGELLALTPSDINLSTKQISITKTYFRQGTKDLITAPKTEKSNRIVEISGFLCDELESCMKSLYGLSDDNRIFPIGARAIQKHMQLHTEKSGVKKIRVHDLRHSHVAMLINMGVQPIVISKRLGHENVTTTMNVYGHLYPNTQRDLADKLDLMKDF